MALLKRSQLKDQGFTDEQADTLMGMISAALADGYVSKEKAKEQADSAAADALKNAPQGDPKDSDDYKAVAAERDMLRALSSDDYAEVKPKFREAVYKMIKHGEKEATVAEQLKAVREKYEEYFNPTETTEDKPQKPTFGANVTGSMPKGNENPTFGDYWGFVPKQH